MHLNLAADVVPRKSLEAGDAYWVCGCPGTTEGDGHPPKKDDFLLPTVKSAVLIGGLGSSSGVKGRNRRGFGRSLQVLLKLSRTGNIV